MQAHVARVVARISTRSSLEHRVARRRQWIGGIAVATRRSWNAIATCRLDVAVVMDTIDFDWIGAIHILNRLLVVPVARRAVRRHDPRSEAALAQRQLATRDLGGACLRRRRGRRRRWWWRRTCARGRGFGAWWGTWTCARWWILWTWWWTVRVRRGRRWWWRRRVMRNRGDVPVFGQNPTLS